MLCFIFGAFRTVRTIAQFGSALDWGSRGRGFKSRWSDQESPSFRRFPRHRNGGVFRTPGAVRGNVLRTSAPGHAIRTRSRFPHARVPSPLGRDVPGGWHGRPYRPMTHSPGDALRHPVRTPSGSACPKPLCPTREATPATCHWPSEVLPRRPPRPCPYPRIVGAANTPIPLSNIERTSYGLSGNGFPVRDFAPGHVRI